MWKGASVKKVTKIGKRKMERQSVYLGRATGRRNLDKIREGGRLERFLPLKNLSKCATKRPSPP